MSRSSRADLQVGEPLGLVGRKRDGRKARLPAKKRQGQVVGRTVTFQAVENRETGFRRPEKPTAKGLAVDDRGFDRALIERARIVPAERDGKTLDPAGSARPAATEAGKLRVEGGDVEGHAAERQ